ALDSSSNCAARSSALVRTTSEVGWLRGAGLGGRVISNERISPTSFKCKKTGLLPVKEDEVCLRLLFLAVEEERGLELAPRLGLAPGLVVGIPEVVVRPRVPGRCAYARFPERDLVHVVELAGDVGAGKQQAKHRRSGAHPRQLQLRDLHRQRKEQAPAR